MQGKGQVHSLPLFRKGVVVDHRIFGYRGVICQVDPVFRGTDSWYERVARSRPPKDRPWYHVLVHRSRVMTYVAERHLVRTGQPGPVVHPMIGDYFSGYADGLYLPNP